MLGLNANFLGSLVVVVIISQPILTPGRPFTVSSPGKRPTLLQVKQWPSVPVSFNGSRTIGSRPSRLIFPWFTQFTPHCWIPPWQVALRHRAFRARGSGCEVNRHPNCWVISWDFMEFHRNARAHFLGCNEINDGDIL